MEEQSLKQKAARGVVWSFVDRFVSQGMTIIIGIIVARILSPSDYGLIGMLAIFMEMSTSMIDSGFPQALIHKVDRTEIDFSTVFYTNLGISIILYLSLFVSSPWIADFYNAPQLESITRVVALNFVINALILVPQTKLTIKVDFKTLSKISLISIIISGIIGITLAVKGFGVWALVFQGLIHAIAKIVLYWFYSKWKPLLVFSIKSFRQLFRYSSKLLASLLLFRAYNNVYLVIIGKYFNASDLGYYYRAKQFESIPAENLTHVMIRVSFPILCKIQNDNAKFVLACRKFI